MPPPLPYSKSSKPYPLPPPPPPLRRLLLVSAASLLIGFALAAAALRRPPPRTVAVFRCGAAEDTARTFRSRSGGDAGVDARPKLLGFVGVITRLGAADRRAALRGTWFPADPEGLASLEHATGLAFRFVIGRTKNARGLADLRKEEEKYHDFMIIDAQEENIKPPQRMLEFFKAAFKFFDADFYVKVDDNVYMRPDRLATLLAKDRSDGLTYIGCMKKGPVITDSKSKWYESSGDLIGNEYFLHAHSPIYALSKDVVAALVTARNNSLRMFSHEDVTVGSWMLGMDVKYEDNRVLCDTQCTPASIAVWDMPRCSGLCNPVDRIKELHNISVCSRSPTLPLDDDR